jgi:type III restriction enzyme
VSFNNEPIMKNPIINSPYQEPNRHFKADERGLTDEILDFRRPSSFYIPVPRAKTLEIQPRTGISE